ncbi:Fe-S oxidoreductase [Desulfosporosinus orientis DSM 765]|uniref:Fe-S oxidoreductase n=1 Tax=Desulfosporosinus orientis (strain ATCC 19365 / DSM 765 / NCIMB 8382 / VKM B-1628 / Singapore I) TaxID=768706 RepID=G7WCS2_DESOD|nr:radical SAM protein [Desulfosporosinus orientis]AET66828.1 Fe-S oxidoreductase [Desulfosporosinus orientis DSM 765]
MSKGLVIAAVHPGSIAEEMEIEVGDRVLAVNEEELRDIIDFQYGISEDEFMLLIEKADGELWELDIEKDPGEFLGLEVETVSAEGLKKCNNNCSFCFVAQMPKGMRSSLYDRDDDYRLSLTQGSFITLSNLSEEDLDRITSLHLSPMYVSVHAWNPEVRTQLMKNPRAGKLPEQFRRLAEAGIVVHAQIVLVPEHNDGDALKETVERLGELYPSVQSIAVVPVGLTRFREKLTPLRGFTGEEASQLLDLAEKWQQEFFKKTGRHLVYFSDEFYILASRKFPEFSVYDDFPQLENGVGMARKFITEMESAWDQLPDKVSKRTVHLITGKAAFELFTTWGKRLMERVENLSVKVHEIHNDFFGLSVTAAGLLTAQDIARQLGDLLGENFLIPRTMLKADEDIFLDDLSVEWLEEKVNGKASIVDNHGLAFLEHVIGYSLEVYPFE